MHPDTAFEHLQRLQSGPPGVVTVFSDDVCTNLGTIFS